MGKEEANCREDTKLAEQDNIDLEKQEYQDVLDESICLTGGHLWK